MPEISFESERLRWESWSSRYTPDLESAIRRIPQKSGATEASPDSLSPYSLFWEPGYNFPSVRVRSGEISYQLALHPIVKKCNGTGLSRVAPSPSLNKVAVLIQTPHHGQDQLVVIDGTSGTLVTAVKSVYDFAWGANDDSLVYSKVVEGLPAEIWLHKTPYSTLVSSALSLGDSLLLRRTLDGRIAISHHTPQGSERIELISTSTDGKCISTRMQYLASAVAMTENGIFILRHAQNPYGEVQHITHHGIKRLVLKGTKARAILSLEEMTKYAAVAYISTGHTIEAAILDDNVRITAPRAPFQRVQIKKGGDISTATLEGPGCPPIPFESDLTCRDAEKIEKIFVGAPGDPQVPVTIIHPKSKTRGFILVAYGAYGVPLSTGYSERLHFLLKESFALVLCHARGGGEFGPQWHIDGMGPRKFNTVRDVVACASHVKNLEEGKDIPLIGYGVSAGAWPFIKAQRRATSLFDALLFDAPMSHAFNAQQVGDVRLATREFEEWNGAEVQKDMQRHKGCTKIISVVREQDALIPSTDIVRWLQDERSHSKCPEWVVGYPAGNQGHSSALRREQEDHLRAAWKILLNSLSRDTPVVRESLSIKPKL